MVGGDADPCPEADSPAPTQDNQWATSFIDRGRGLHAKTAQSALTVVLKSVMQWSAQDCLDGFKYS